MPTAYWRKTQLARRSRSGADRAPAARTTRGADAGDSAGRAERRGHAPAPADEVRGGDRADRPAQSEPARSWPDATPDHAAVRPALPLGRPLRDPEPAAAPDRVRAAVARLGAPAGARARPSS